MGNLPKFLLFWSFFCGFAADDTKIPLRLMTFNTWNTGKNVEAGIIKIAREILRVNADIVALQEIEDSNVFATLKFLLGSKWQGVYRPGNYPDAAIVTRHQLIENSCNHTDYSLSCSIRLNSPHDSVKLNVWSVHFDWKNYGPYAACNKMVNESFQIEAGEYDLDEGTQGRAINALVVLKSEQFRRHLSEIDQNALILMGDFNSPSHLDWTEQAKNLHCGWAFQWPATFLLNDKAKLLDAYRQLHPDPVKDPGNTWSTIQKTEAGYGRLIPEPQDRIDLIFYRSERLKPIAADPYQGHGLVMPAPYSDKNDWPSDHFAVVADFEYHLQQRSNANFDEENSD